jgi:hypothetical protein
MGTTALTPAWKSRKYSYHNQETPQILGGLRGFFLFKDMKSRLSFLPLCHICFSNNKFDMKADVNTLTHIFWDYNKKCFGNSLPTPYIELFDKPGKIARFEYHKNGKKAKKPIRNQIIYFSKTYEFNENTMRDVMVHEMIHYYIAWNRIKDNGSHGRKFWRMAKDLNEQYGLNIEIYAGAPLPDKPIGYFQRIINVIRRW